MAKLNLIESDKINSKYEKKLQEIESRIKDINSLLPELIEESYKPNKNSEYTIYTHSGLLQKIIYGSVEGRHVLHEEYYFYNSEPIFISEKIFLVFKVRSSEIIDVNYYYLDKQNIILWFNSGEGVTEDKKILLELQKKWVDRFKELSKILKLDISF